MESGIAKVLFTNRLVGLNIKVEKNDRGWYRVKLSELNTYNNKGEYYLADGFKELLEEKKSYLSVANRLESGLLEGEVTHPIREGHTDNEWVTRNLVIDGARTSHAIMQLEYVPTDRTDNGRTVIEVWGWILPTDNDAGRALKASLENPDVNVAFSIRCFSRTVTINGVVCRIITKIITWDKIDIPGLKNAIKGGDRNAIFNRQNEITREAGLVDIYLDDEQLDEIITGLKDNSITSESANDMISVFRDLKSNKEDAFMSW